MEFGPFSTCGSRPSAAHVRLDGMHQLQWWRAVPYRHGFLAIAARASVRTCCRHLQRRRTAHSPNWALAFDVP
eukprot:5783963-Pyramimonas_sp.AAC.1